MPNYVDKYPCIILLSNSNVDMEVHPENDKANAALQTFFTASGANTTVAITQVDSERDGVGSSLGQYKGVKFDLSA